MIKRFAPLVRRVLGVIAVSALPLMAQAYYTQMRISTSRDSLTTIDTLRLRSDQDTTLFALGKRSDNGQWDGVSVSWSVSRPRPLPTAPVSALSWTFGPIDTGSCDIIAKLTAAPPLGGVTLADTVHFVTIVCDCPLTLRLYPALGAPSLANAPYPRPPAAIQCTVGAQLPIVVKVFEENGFWRSEYEQSPADTVFHWKVIEYSGLAPTGTLSATSGCKTSFLPMRGYNIVAIAVTAARFYLSDTLRVIVLSHPIPNHLVIEPDTNGRIVSPIQANPVDTIILSTVQNSRSVYGIIRDTFGNFVDYSTSTDWKSTDTTIASVHAGQADIGEGIITGVGQGQAKIIAATNAIPGATDTVVVKVLPWAASHVAPVPVSPARLRVFLPGMGALAIPFTLTGYGLKGKLSFSLHSLRGQTVFMKNGLDPSQAVVVDVGLRSGLYLFCLMENRNIAAEGKVAVVK